MTFRVGQKVVCVDVANFTSLDGDVEPIKGNIYSIRQTYENDGKSGLFLAEIINPPCHHELGYSERPFRASRFRPLVTRTQQQDMEQFIPLLINNQVPA